MGEVKPGITPDAVKRPEGKAGRPVKNWSDRFGAHVPVLKHFQTPQRKARGIVAGCFVLGLSTCSATAPATSGCDLNQPFRPTTESIEVMSDREVADALSHNTYGARTCGWKA